jgi:hypothetical protein
MRPYDPSIGVAGGLTTPDNIQTRMGELNFFDGVPDIETAQKVYNLLDFTHACQTFLDGTKIASMDGIRKGILEFGPVKATGDRLYPARVGTRSSAFTVRLSRDLIGLPRILRHCLAS